jgi:hypothetical protein
MSVHLATTRGVVRAISFAHVLGLACWLLAACTEPTQRRQLRVLIDADSDVRKVVEDVTALVEFQDAKGGGWREIGGSRRFETKAQQLWPLEFILDASDVRRDAMYQLTATARDGRMAVVGQARAVRTFDSGQRRTLSVLFEASCLHRSQLCGSGQTCTMNTCVDAREYDGGIREPALTGDAASGDAGDSINQQPVPIASDGESCETSRAVACGGTLSRVPLRCTEVPTDAGVQLMWRAESQCKEDELCDTTLASSLRGMCRKIAPECQGRTPDAVFCDQETMRVCASMFKSEVRPCAEHARCIDPNKSAICACSTGFIEDASKNCVVATDCAVANGGCDELTKCTMQQGKPVCSGCPAGFVGDGKNGCSALLAGLSVAHGTLEPAFSPGVTEYRIELPLLVQRLTLTASAPDAGRIAINGEEVTSGNAWMTPTLPLGEYIVDLALTSPASGSVHSYKVRIVRAGAQRAYIKASNTGSSDNFGVAIALDGDTLVVGALYEDSAATGVNGDQSSQASTDSGAAYVFVRKAGSWEQQAYLKASDTAPQALFGSKVAVFGNTIAVSALHTDAFRLGASPGGPGSVYVFERKDGSWRETAKLVPSGSMNADLFGVGLALERDTMIVGSPGEAGSGAAYAFVRDSAGWHETARLQPRTPVAKSKFGASVAVRGDTAVVGAPDDSSERSGCGSASVFVRTGERWVETQRLSPNPASDDASFGFSIALGDDTLLIGAPRELSIATPTLFSSGEVFAYELVGGSWQQSQVIKALVARSSDSFGSAVALHEDSALVGACGDASGGVGIGADPSRRDAPYAGAGYLFAREGRKWVASLYLKASNTDSDSGASFGYGAALSENSAVLSAIWERSAATGIDGNQQSKAATRSGALYVFE